MTFKYNGKLITTPNLEKKLKRMHLTLADIEIVPDVEVKKEVDELIYPIENYHYYKYPNENKWLVYITNNPPETIKHPITNETLVYDREHTF